MVNTAAELRPLRRSLSWRMGSSLVMGLTGLLSKGFLYGLNNVETRGMEPFLKLLDERKSGNHRQGIITACNHTSVLDDPLTWGILPLRYAFDPNNLRWGLGAHDICFKNNFTKKFFSLGQVLPTHRLLHSPHGGIFQPTMDEAVQLLSGEKPSPSSKELAPTFTTRAGEKYPAASSYNHCRKAWLHVYPEACVHQHPEMVLRYFKWGVSRLVLESNPAPRFVPMFIDGLQNVMHESRKKPRWLPRVGKKILFVFGEAVDSDALFKEQREKWRDLVRRHEHSAASTENQEAGYPKFLEDAHEVQALRIEVAEIVRDQVARLRESSGYPPDDPAFARAETWLREPADKRFKSPVDGSIVHRE